ncbi:MAG: glycosyltransferase family 4 protein [Actinobacteria bacterium]|nr:glycosyltransferase family 4 protein [Actinomycetota bacterium]
MSRPEAVVVSYRLGGADGVGVEAGKWEWALRELGFTTRRVAGELEGASRPDDTWLAFLAIDPVAGARPDPEALAATLAGADLVVVENLCSLPLNVEAAIVTRDVLAAHRGRVCFHHHDFAWERPRLAHIDGFPPDRPGSVHVTISERARADLARRGIPAFAVPNSFDFDAFDGDRAPTRSALGFTDDDVVLLQPTRAIPRKNTEGGLRFAEAVARRLGGRRVHYWITGPAEEGFGAELERMVAATSVPVHVGRAPRSADAYAAADLVVFPSTWEGFGNPVVEATAARRMTAVGWYPVLDEITTDLELCSIDDPDGAVEWLGRDEADRGAVLEANRATARARFAIEHLPDRIRSVFAAVGWTDW